MTERAAGSSDSPVVVVAYGATVHGLDRATGEPRWEHQVGQHDLVETLELGLDDGLLLTFAGSTNELWCIAYPSGEVLGRAILPFTVSGRPAMIVDGDDILVAMHREVVCVSRRGQVRWHRPLTETYKKGSTAIAIPGKVRQADLKD